MKFINILLCALSLIQVSGCKSPPKQLDTMAAEANFLKPSFVAGSDFLAANDTSPEQITINALPSGASLSTNGFAFADFSNDKDVISLLKLSRELIGNENEDSVVEFTTQFINFQKLVAKWSQANLPAGMTFDGVFCDLPVYRNTAKSGLYKGALNFAHADFESSQPLHKLFEAIQFSKLTQPESHQQFISEDFWKKFELVTMLNFWSPVEPIESNPLAVVDKSSLKPGDLVQGTLTVPGIGLPFTGLFLKHNAGQRYFYRPYQDVAQMLVFETLHTPHFSFKLPEQSNERESVEFRCAFIKKR